MKIYFLSSKKRKEARRELTEEEKEIYSNGLTLGFLVGLLIGGAIEWFILTFKIIIGPR